ncbi:MAG: DUF5683 domain-containing protein [Prevotella sp.]|jgi:hypothetical protein|nr:DUF5683 domain-containing protein [Prevotella sp.]
MQKIKNWIATALLFTGTVSLYAQETVPDTISVPTDSLIEESFAPADSLKSILLTDTISKPLKVKKDWSQWQPDPQRALWLALVIPGGGQIYNRKYWKLPLVYGGFIGCLYAMNWNNNMYKDYSQAYLDITDNDPGTASYNKFLHLGMQITPTNENRYKEIFKSRKNKYRRWRDLSFFVLCGVYALSVIDAYVDAELSVFDISRDLSLRVEPTIMDNHSSRNPLDASSIGLQCSLNF